MDYYQFGNLTLGIDCPRPLAKSKWMEPFRTGGTGDGPRAVIRCVLADFPLPDGARLLRRAGGGTQYFTDGTTEYMVYQRKNQPKPQLVMPITAGPERTLYLSPSLDEGYFSAHILLEHIELIGLLQNYGIWVLHCCYVKTAQGAVLFTANSGVGKSTQGRLWEESGRGTVINGDRATVFYRKGQLWAGGFVYSGSSGICKNEAMPVRAIVRLRQEPENRILPLRPAEQVKTLYMQLVSCPYREAESRRKLDFAAALCRDTEVLGLACTPDQRAVDALENYLRK